MRGIYSSVTDIRRKVFTEVARLAYEGGDYSRIEELPYKILPGEAATYREASSWSAPSSANGFALQSGCRYAPSTSIRWFPTALWKAPLPRNTTIRRW